MSDDAARITIDLHDAAGAPDLVYINQEFGIARCRSGTGASYRSMGWRKTSDKAADERIDAHIHRCGLRGLPCEMVLPTVPRLETGSYLSEVLVPDIEHEPQRGLRDVVGLRPDEALVPAALQWHPLEKLAA